MNEIMTVAILQAHLDRLDDGVLQYGAHKPGKAFCALEFKSQVDGIPWTDSPAATRLPDIRPLNDLFPIAANKERTDALLLVMAAFWNWRNWSPKKKVECVRRIVVGTVNRVIAELPYLPTSVSVLCRNADSLAAADTATRAAADAAAGAAARAAYAAARAAAAAGAADAAQTKIGQTACKLWIDATVGLDRF